MSLSDTLFTDFVKAIFKVPNDLKSPLLMFPNFSELPNETSIICAFYFAIDSLKK